MASAVRRLSPVSITVRMPASFNVLSPAIASARGSSRMAMAPAILPSATSTETVLPSSLNAVIRAASSSGMAEISLAALREPRNSSMPLALPDTPLPPWALPVETSDSFRPRASAAPTIASARGWLEPASSDAARRRTSSSESPAGRTSVTCGLPSVSVPVLSKQAVVILPIVSRTAPPFNRSPRRAPAESEAAIAAGVEITSAQGQPISKMARPL